MSTEIDNLDQLFEQTKSHLNDNKQALNELDELDIYCGENEYDIEHFKDDLEEMENEYISYRNSMSSAKNLFAKITEILTGKVSKVNPQEHQHQQQQPQSYHQPQYPQPTQSLIDEEEKLLITQRKYNKVNFFIKRVNFQKQRSVFETRDEAYILVDNFIPDEYRYLRPFEKICCKNQIALSEYLVTGYHESGLSINEYIGQNELFNQLNQYFNLAPTSKNINKSRDLMVNYLIEYEKSMAKPLPSSPLILQKNDKIRPFKDDITIIIDYMNEINNGLKNAISNNAAYPIHLDVFFVAPNHHANLDLHSLDLKGIRSDKESRKNGTVNATEDMYHILRRCNDINKYNKQRFIMLVVRANTDNSEDDTIYLFKPDDNNAVAPKFISDSCELTYLINSKSQIVPGLNSTDPGVLGWNHHLHSSHCNKVYLSYGNYKSRVFKDSILHKLQCLFDHHNERRHQIGSSIKGDFMNSYKKFTDTPYEEVGEYWFNNQKRYQCYEPYWNPSNCRAMGNVFIPKSNPSCTQDLLEYIDEKSAFESAEKLYYKLDYTVGMQIVDKQTICMKFHKENKFICLINTELHKDGKALYAVIEKNPFKSKQKWKIIDYKQISEAFMTSEQLIEKYEIFKWDLPVGSKMFHNAWTEELKNIQVTKQLIRTTNWSHIRIVQSKQNISKMDGNDNDNNDEYKNNHKNNKKQSNKRNKGKKNKNNKNKNNSDNNNNNNNGKGVLRISERRFKQLALKALQHCELTPIAHFKFRKNKYHLEKLLPVKIPEHNKYVAISFWFNQLSEKGRTQASGVCLDLTDMKNKANLVNIVPEDSWLNKADENMTINSLVIGQNDDPPTNPNHHTHNNNNNKNHNKQNRNKNKNKNKNKKRQQRPRQNCNNNNNNNVNNNNNNINRNNQQQNIQPPKKQQQQQQHQQLQNQQQPPQQALSPVQSIPSVMSSPSQSPNMIINNNNNNNNNNNGNMSEITFVPSKVPVSYQQKIQQQQRPKLQQQQAASTPLPQPQSMLNYSALSSIPQSVPQLFTSSSIGSVSSQLTTQAPMPSMPTISPQSSIPSSISAFPSVPNFQPPNLQHYQQNAQYFASFLPASLQQPQQQQLPSIPTQRLQQQQQQQPFVNATVSTNFVSSVPVANCNYNTSPITHSQPTYMNYNQQYQFNAYPQ